MDDLLNFAGTLFVLRFHWFWMLVALGLGVWVGWRTAGEGAAEARPRAGVAAVLDELAV